MADYTIPASPLKRLRYYNNQFLTEKDFIDDQAAHLAHERAQLRALCAPGVWEGLGVSYAAAPTTSAPVVGVGIAVDALGRLIVLDPQATGPAPSTLANGDYLLSIQYNEVATDMSTNTGGSAGTADNTRFTSQPVLTATVASAVPAGAVVLGSFAVTGGQITTHSDAGRQYAGLRLPGPVLPGAPPATLTNRNDGSADGVQLTGTLTVQKTSAAAIGPSLTLANPNPGPGGLNAGGAIDFHSYAAGSNAPAARIQSLGDASFSSDLAFSTKAPGAIGNGLVERLRITSSGAAQFTGAVSAPSATVPTLNGPVAFSGAVTAPSLSVATAAFSGAVSALSMTVPTFNGPVAFTGAVTVSSQLLAANGGLSVTGAVGVSGATTTGSLSVTGDASLTNIAVSGTATLAGATINGSLTTSGLSVSGATTNLGAPGATHTIKVGGVDMFQINPAAKRLVLLSGWTLFGNVSA